MDTLRTAARESLLGDAPLTPPPSASISDSSVAQLWQHISRYMSRDHLVTCESLLVAQTCLNTWTANPLPEDDEQAANHLYSWASSVALPSPYFTVTFDETAEISAEITRTLDESRLRSKLAVSVLVLLNKLLPIHEAASASDIVVALASFTAESDPWTTTDTLAASTATLQAYSQATRSESDDAPFWSTNQHILKERIRPLFTKTRNPAITSAGRKNVYPVPLARFDGSILDQEARPWKTNDVYATTVLSWIIAQYHPTDQTHVEAHFPLLVPAILALIDDSSIPFKTKGCYLLTQLLHPIRDSGSSILQRTNLASVFEDAVTPCLLSLPTITPEDDSLELLGAAYPALLSLFQTAYTTPKSQTTKEEEKTYITKTTKILRSNLISSFHHTSSTSAANSFPYPRLSTFLTNQITIFITELHIHTTKYLQDLIPLLYTILTNPFAPAYPPLLRSGIAATTAVILNAHPRIWRWRSEILGGICACWIHVLEEEKANQRKKETSESDTDQIIVDLASLKRELQGTVFLLKHAISNPVSREGAVDRDQEQARNCLQGELKTLADADGELRDLLLAEVGTGDGDCFGGLVSIS